jgi:antibiotic biosynthesis monooxygenase
MSSYSEQPYRKEQNMYVAVRRYQVKAGSIDELARRAQEGYVPLVSQVPGFVAYYGVAAGNDRIFTVSVFQDQAGADESTRLAADWVSQNIAEFLQGPPEVTAGEVRWSS